MAFDFVQGVVDSADLPLNVSRYLWHSPVLAKIRTDLLSGKLISDFEKSLGPEALRHV